MAINPYRQMPIYDEQIVKWYRGQGRSDRPPHIFGVADAAYQALLATRRSQSILVTGESGAGKTENTKRVIHYLTSISSGAQSNDELERQLILSNPILEAFGNAQTVRNNNSSRFGKFIRIEIDPNAGNITGAAIETYLLEKSRVTHRPASERSFHVFYQLLAGEDEDVLKNELLLPSQKPEDFAYLKQSQKSIVGVDDAAEFAALKESLTVVGVGTAEQLAMFKTLAAILLLGNLQLTEDAQTGQAILNDSQISLLQSICTLLSVPLEDFRSALLNPVIRAGREIVSQARDCDQVQRSIEALSRSLYERLFAHVVGRLNALLFRNKTASTASTGKSTFIGVLDIAGFEIFAQNGFEQLLINYTNEKLQQFFNHHMFIVEQEEYARQGIQWNFVDFGVDSQPMIDLLERGGSVAGVQPGILACLDEDCVMPKATDKSFTAKVQGFCHGQAKFEVDRLKADRGFALSHYAGKVEYSTAGWLEKNKDPVNESVCRLLASSGERDGLALFADFNEQFSHSKGQKSGKNLALEDFFNCRLGMFRTVAQKHRESLTLLMSQLQATQPHFVRCILPNSRKQPGLLQDRLVLDQLKCNGVLEGIRICRQGYPNRLSFADFHRLYSILAKGPKKPENLEEFLRELMGWKQETDYAVGEDKIFFRAGRLGQLDALRDAQLAEALRHLQAACRGALVREERDRAAKQAEAIKLLQKQLKPFVAIKRNPWIRLLCRVKPLLTVTRAENRIKQLQTQLIQAQNEHETQAAALKTSLEEERTALAEWQSKWSESERNRARLASLLQEKETKLTALTGNLNELNAAIVDGTAKQAQLDGEIKLLKAKIADNEHQMTVLTGELEATRARQATQSAELEAAHAQLLKSQAELKETERAHETALAILEGEKTVLKAQLALAQENCQELEVAVREAQGQADNLALEARAQQRALQAETERVRQEATESLENAKRRSTRELENLRSELESEKKTILTLKEAIKAYETDTTQVEAERARNTQTFKRERERLETKTRDALRQRDEALEREEALQRTLTAAHEQARQARLQLADAEDKQAEQAQIIRQLESKVQAANEQSRTQITELDSLRSQIKALREEICIVEGAAEEAQDSLACAKESLNGAEEVRALLQAQLDASKLTLAKVEAERDALQAELTAQPRQRSNSLAATGLDEVIARLEADCTERQQLIRESRRLDRELRDALDALRDREADLLQANEVAVKADLRGRKLATELENSTAQTAILERAKRRLEAELTEERERADRLQRDVERLRLQQRQQQQLDALESASALGHNRTMSCASIASSRATEIIE